MITKTRFKTACISMAIILVFSLMASAATVPTFETLPSVEGMPASINQIATSSDGTIYIADTFGNSVKIHSRSGKRLGSIPFEKPIAIAVNAAGTKYVASAKDRSVRIFGSGNTQIGVLGAGAQEFQKPAAIVIDPATNDVYVVDSNDNSIKVYTAAGLFQRRIDDGQNYPVGAAILNNELYVIDQPVELSSSVPPVPFRTARVQVFSLSGGLLRSFGSYGIGTGQFIRPAGVASDNAGRIYISDAYQGVVLAFDASTGEYLGAVYSPAAAMVTPVGVSVTGEGKLIVASQQNGAVRIFGLDNYSDLAVATDALAFAAKQGLANPSAQIISLTNNGKGAVGYTAAADKPWITIAQPSGSVAGKSATDLSIGVDIAGLAVGTYAGAVTVNGASGVKETVPVTLEIRKSAKIRVSATSVSFTYATGAAQATPAAQAIAVELSDDDAGTTTWTASATKGWIAVTPGSATGNSTTNATVTVDAAALAAGSYQGTISFAAGDAVGSPAEVTVNLRVVAVGAITVTTNLPEAKFDITGPASSSGSGTSWNANNMPEGTYTIKFRPVAGYKTPSSQTQTLTGGQPIAFSGTYTRQAANILAGPGYSETGAKMGVFGLDGLLKKEITPLATLASKFGFVSAVGDVDGDGRNDIIVGRTGGVGVGARIAAYGRNGGQIAGANFLAFTTMFGVTVAAGDFDGDGRDEIVAGTGPGDVNDALVRIFSLDSGKIRDTGIHIQPFATKFGVNVAAGDIDGDGKDELIVAPGPDPLAAASVKIFKIETAGGIGSWTATDTGVSIKALESMYGATVAAGDLDGDGAEEIIAGAGLNKAVTNSKVAAFHGDGTSFGLTITEGSAGGLSVAAGDLNLDGKAEIIVGAGRKYANPAVVKVFRSDGTLETSFTAYTDTSSGVNVSAGELGY